MISRLQRKHQTIVSSNRIISIKKSETFCERNPAGCLFYAFFSVCMIVSNSIQLSWKNRFTNCIQNVILRNGWYSRETILGNEYGAHPFGQKEEVMV